MILSEIKQLKKSIMDNQEKELTDIIEDNNSTRN